MKLLIYGSTYLTERVVSYLKEVSIVELVGYIPSTKPTFPGKIDLPIVTGDIEHDIALSIQYDQKIFNPKAYNLHTGLLPLYGGCDILYHTLENKENEQGLTFHKIVDELDAGQIISKITYPVSQSDLAIDLYMRMCVIAPYFVHSCLQLLEIGIPSDIPTRKPARYKRGDVKDKAKYEKDYQIISEVLGQ